MIPQSYWFVGIFWLIYLSVHSILASNYIKGWLFERIPSLESNYRMVYSTIAVLLLLPFLYFLLLGPKTYMHLPFKNEFQVLGLGLTTFAFLVFKRSFSYISTGEFLGTKKSDKNTLVTHGIYAKVRHPLYSATILFLIGFWLFMPTVENIITTACICLYIPIGIWLEEKKLVAVFGTQYQKYAQKVPALFPNFISSSF
jgi:protein-S-isoprenylcysteine O-methyltransferase Ste14